MLIAVNACATLCFVVALHPTSVVAFVMISVWLLAPHLVLLGILTGIRRMENPRMAALRVLAVLASAVGSLFLALVVYGPSDAQNAIAIFYTPALQGAVWLFGLPIVICIPKESR